MFVIGGDVGFGTQAVCTKSAWSAGIMDRMVLTIIQILSEIFCMFARSRRIPHSARVRRFALGAGASGGQMRRRVN